MIKSIEINANPVTKWEKYHKSLYPKRVGRGADFYDLDRENSADEGFGRLRFKIRGTRPDLEEFFEYGLGRDVRVFNKKGQLDYEGYIHSMTLNTSYHMLRKSLQYIFNKVWARFDDSGGVEDTKRSTVFEDLDSQAQFGIIEKVMGGGQQADLSAMDTAVQNRLILFAWPMVDPDLDAGSGDPYIQIACTGYINTLGWRVYNQTENEGNENISVVVQDVIDECGQFIASSTVQSNVLQIPQEYDVDRFAKDIVASLAAMGDSSGNRWLARMVKDRHFTFGAAARVK